MQKASKRFVLLVELASWSPSSAGRGEREAGSARSSRVSGPNHVPVIPRAKGALGSGQQEGDFCMSRGQTGTHWMPVVRHSLCHDESVSRNDTSRRTLHFGALSRNHLWKWLEADPTVSARFELARDFIHDVKRRLEREKKETMRWKLRRDCLEFQFFFLIENICWNRKMEIEWRLCYCITRIERKIVEIY